MIRLDTVDIRAGSQCKERLLIAGDGQTVEDPVGREGLHMTRCLLSIEVGCERRLADGRRRLQRGNERDTPGQRVQSSLRWGQTGLGAHVDEIGRHAAVFQLFQDLRLDLGHRLEVRPHVSSLRGYRWIRRCSQRSQWQRR